jgi:hypothetical protein
MTRRRDNDFSRVFELDLYDTVDEALTALRKESCLALAMLHAQDAQAAARLVKS